MRPFYRWTALAAMILGTTLAFGQAAPTAAPVGNNPLMRNDGRGMFSGGIGASPLNTNTGIGRPATRYGPAVNPVPEPSQWLMMLAGLGILAFIARRGSTHS